MFDLAKIEQLVETALEQFAMHQEHVDPVSCLDNLHAKVAVMVEAFAADSGAVLRMRPSGKQRRAIDEPAFKVECRAGA